MTAPDGPARIEKVDLAAAFDTFDERWSPRIVAALNGQHVKVAKVEGDFVWHSHADEDELFFVVRGRLEMHLRDRVIELGPGELLVVPRGVEHKPVAPVETHILLFEPAGTINTGDADSDRRVDPDWID